MSCCGGRAAVYIVAELLLLIMGRPYTVSEQRYEFVEEELRILGA